MERSQVTDLVKAFYSQTRNYLPLLVKIYFPIVVLLGIFALIQIFYGIKVSHFTRDPIQVLSGEAYVGILSNLGILGWMGTVSITFFTSIMLRSRGNQPEAANFLFYSALFTAFLMLDDLFLFHERLFPVSLHIPETLVYLLYGLISLLYLFKFLPKILEGEFALLFLAIFFLGGSVFVDLLTTYIWIPGDYLIEDGLKFIGIVTWLLFFYRKATAYLLLDVSTKEEGLV